jgi:hypothetical protein
MSYRGRGRDEEAREDDDRHERGRAMADGDSGGEWPSGNHVGPNQESRY